MNYPKITYWLLILILFSCSIKKGGKEYYSTGIIIPFEGVDKIKVNESEIKDIKRNYKNIKIKKYWEPWGNGPILPFFFIGHYKKKVTVKEKEKEKGLTFYLEKKKHRFQKRTVFSIVVDSTSTYKTKEGIGIGSSYKDIISVFGKTTLSSGSTLRGTVAHLYFRDSNKNSSMLFTHFGAIDTNNFTVQEIVIM